MIASPLFFAVFWLSLLVEFATTRPVRYQAAFQGPIKVNAAPESHRVCTPGMSQCLGYCCEDLPKSQDLVVFASERPHALMPSMVFPASETPRCAICCRSLCITFDARHISYVEGPLGLYDPSWLHSRDLYVSIMLSNLQILPAIRPKPQKPPVIASERSDRLMQNVAFCSSEMPSCEDITSAVGEPSQVHTGHSIKTRLLASEGYTSAASSLNPVIYSPTSSYSELVI
ncbi:hypothetical protein DFS33DRAFT_737412 [Desarmillaria ectypa]|nr:hypothetical protein DFS33DRAFT_737412 [Desarmillaria ectypa]